MEEFWNREGPAEIMMVAEGSQVHDLALVTHSTASCLWESVYSHPQNCYCCSAISNAIGERGVKLDCMLIHTAPNHPPPSPLPLHPHVAIVPGQNRHGGNANSHVGHRAAAFLG
jgi:hypothetical protein